RRSGRQIGPCHEDAREGRKGRGRPFRSFLSGARPTKVVKDGARRQGWIKWARRTRDGSLSRKATCLPLLLSPGSRGSLSRIARPPRAMCSDVGQVRQCAPQCGDVQRCGLGEASETA
ncbi:unnamed protein product, partial [Prorocentrum cordatum]